MSPRVLRLGAVLFAVASCSSTATQPDEAAPTVNTSAALAVAPTSPTSTEPEPAIGGTQFIFPLVTGTLQGPNSNVAGWAASRRDQVPEAAAVPVIVPATLTAEESVKVDINRITDHPFESTVDRALPSRPDD